MDEGMIAAFMIPLGLSVVAVGILFVYYRTKAKKLDTLVKVAELGGSIDPDMMKMLSEGGGGYKADFKAGLIWLAVGIPLTLGMFQDGGVEDATFGLIPVFVGIAYLIAAKYRLREV